MLRARPTYSLLSEESAEIVGEEPSLRWIIDPLDGTLNYMHGFPHWAISVACEKNGEIVAAVTYDPVKNEMFLAEKGCGAYVNDKKIRVSGKRARSDLLIGVSSFSKIDHLVKNIPSATCSIRKSGSITLDMAYLAAGRIDILFAPENLNEWDVAAGMLLIREAGGFLASPDGKSVSDYKDIAMMSNIDLLPIATKMF
jgi:myo-inositol-1(or 4)-monophosphatase